MYNFNTRLAKLLNIFTSKSIGHALSSISLYNTDNEVEDLLGENFQIPATNFDSELDDIDDDIDKMLFIDCKTYLPDNILVKIDRASMAVSIEAREPLLDYRLVETVSSFPVNLKINKLSKKFILKRFVHSLIPSKLMERPKKGFGIPLDDLMRGNAKSDLFKYLDDERILRTGLLNNESVQRLKKLFI